MIEVEVSITCDLCLSSVEAAINYMKPHRPVGRVFFVAYTSEHRVFSRATEMTLTHGYDAVFCQPSASLPNAYAWDFIMYSNETGEPIARIQHRPEA